MSAANHSDLELVSIHRA